MSAPRRRVDEERRLRRAAVTAASRQPPEELHPARAHEEPADSGDAEGDADAGLRLEQKALWVDLQVRRAIDRGEFDDLPGAGKPIPGLSGTHDPDWWVKRLIERERLTGVLPPALALRKEDATLEAQLDREATEQGVRRLLEDFNHRVVEARRQLLGGPPVVTATRDVDQELAAWRARRDERRREQQRRAAATLAEQAPARPRWWRRRRA